MKKILVVGSSGAGKSTFARHLGKTTGLEVIHLDKIFWNPGWVETDREEWRKKIEQLSKGDSWIMDGNYSGTLETRLPACDTVIFLDMPRLLCVYRILKRVVFYWPGSRPDMAEGCHEKFNWEFVKYVWNYRHRSKPKVEALLKRFEDTKTVIRLRSKSEIEDFLANCSPKTPQSA
jgi:adenylate kinase family enzyme